MRKDRGQVTLFILLALAIFLLALVGFAVDMTNLWFHRQAAQGAADAACQAGAMNMLVAAQGGPTATQGFTIGTAFNCAGNGTWPPCAYAAFNGYNGAGLQSGVDSNDVNVTFPSNIVGVVKPDPNVSLPSPFMQVDVTDRVRVYFSSLLTRSRTQDVLAKARCGLVLARVPIPIIILQPTCPGSLSLPNSAASLAVVGGPTKSVQVNSSDANAVLSTGATIDLSLGGPNFSGSDFGDFGGPATAPKGFNGGTTGQWVSPAARLADPFKTLPAPFTTGLPVDPTPTFVPHGVNGCPDTKGCSEYSRGWYKTKPIVVKNATAIFDPGIYFITATTNATCGAANCTGGTPTGSCRYGLALMANSIVRPSTAPGDASGGTMFYFSGPSGAGSYGSVFVDANSGNRSVDPFPTPLTNCPGGTPPDPRALPPTPPTGNVLLAPCKGVYGSPTGTDRGILFFDDRANGDLNGQPSMQGGGQMVLAGAMYFHNCPFSTTPTGCRPPPTDYNAFFSLQGNPGSGTFILGNIVADQLLYGGNGSVSMALNINQKLTLLKAALLP